MMRQRWFTKKFEEEAVRLARTSGRTQRAVAADLATNRKLVRPMGEPHARPNSQFSSLNHAGMNDPD